MKKLILLSILFASTTFAQQLDLPRASQAAKTSYTVGLTEIAIEYSSPAVKGRPIWGALVKHGEVWRAGANATTKITFSKDVTFGATAVPAGSYGLFVIPNKDAAAPWTVILSKDWQASPFAYKKESDVARVEVKPEPIANRERLVYLITNATNDGASLDLEWEKVRLSVPVKVGTDAQVAATVKGLEDNAWMPANAVARYYLEQKKDYAQGLVWADRSLKAKEEWFNVWTKAQLLAAQGKTKDAHPLAVKAQQLGEKAPPGRFFFADEVKKAVVDWKPAAGGKPATGGKK